MKYDVIIIGAGPGGIFSAYELVKRMRISRSQCLKRVIHLRSAVVRSTGTR